MTILENLNRLRKSLFRRPEPPKEEIVSVFRFKYSAFKELLASNTELLNIITDIEEKLQGRQIFGMSYIRSQSTRAVFHAFRMVKSLNVLGGHRYPLLYEALEKINVQIKAELGQRMELTAPAFILFYHEINKDMMDWVGGKSANLGEVCNRVKLPIPAGFAITTSAYAAFLAHNDLVDEINKRKMAIDINKPETIQAVSAEIQQLIFSAQVPPELVKAMQTAYQQMEASLGEEGKVDGSTRVSMRSSAIGEDSELSFAGQYLTLLNVTVDKLVDSYKSILASLYTPRAMVYRLNKGIRDEDIAMSLACLQMIDSRASGVIYSHHPFNVMEDNIIISAVWGLGPYAVDGVITPDSYTVAKDRDLSILHTEVARKQVQLVSSPGGGLQEKQVAPDEQEEPCLSPQQIKNLADYALRLEKHYQGPQDIEWALDGKGRLLILQTRPLHVEPPPQEGLKKIPQVPGYPLLVDGGAVAFPGVGCGPACHVKTDEDLINFPEGGVLIAPHSSPKFVLVMQKAQAIITNSGSVSGHMAALVREFAIPTILDTKNATQVIPPGQEVTVDAYSARVYSGAVPELLKLQRPRESHMTNTPVFQTLRRVADAMVPLHLINPKDPNFNAEHCITLHDIGRLVHELSYSAMFQVSDLVSDQGGGAVKLDAAIPLDLYLIDLGGGLKPEASGSHRVRVEKITSVPFKALIHGMLHKDLQTYGPRPVQFSGFLSVMREQMLAPSNTGERFGDRSYAIVSEKYLNFSSRVGYHYGVLDCYCGETINKNYITFSFKGGAADDVRRNRRVRSIAHILEEQAFTVDVKGDRVDARLQKYPRQEIEEKLDMLGRLLIFTRQMDMLMVSEASVIAVAKNFLAGNYHLEEQVFDELNDDPYKPNGI
jgi:pyruvate,water dikinase